MLNDDYLVVLCSVVYREAQSEKPHTAETGPATGLRLMSVDDEGPPEDDRVSH